MPLPAGRAPWFGLTEEQLRFIEVHPARAISIPGRAWRELDDCVMLFSAGESEPFFNRLVAVRFPEDPAEFDARLKQSVDLFRALDRKPYVWAIPKLSTPSDLIARLAANGFVDQGGGYDMLLVRDPSEIPDIELPRGAVLEKWNRPEGRRRSELAEDLALIIGEAFRIPSNRRYNLAVEIELTMGQPYFSAYILRIDGEPVATGERYTFDGASYISSIGTRTAWRGRGFGRHITLALARDSVAAGCDLVYLGVYADNTAAIRLYNRLGFAMLGPRSSDMLQEHSQTESGQ
jgi:ribosomal protein S18 acetylase RimI-like enzyme